MMILKQENDALRFALNADGSAQIEDKIGGVSWRMAAFAWQEEGPIDVGHVWQRTGRSVCEQFVGRFRLQVEAGSESIVRCTLLDELNHRFLSEDFAVEETQFSNGSAIIANFAPEPRTVEGITIAAGGFHIR